MLQRSNIILPGNESFSHTLTITRTDAALVDKEHIKEIFIFPNSLYYFEFKIKWQRSPQEWLSLLLGFK